PPVVATRVGPAAAEALGDDRIRSVDYPLHIDGELHHYAARILRLAAEDGTVEGVLWLARDITDRKRIEQALFQERNARR
ncbi:MAG TPA: PAS domain-containing protein, partial [Plasticicumulans sp.]|nr:PAS domain-containing protein [Plasticicumulans sp.]